jgi:serralysin
MLGLSALEWLALTTAGGGRERHAKSATPVGERGCTYVWPRMARWALLTAICLAIPAAPAGAATVSLEFVSHHPGGDGTPAHDVYRLTFAAAAGETNDVTIRGVPRVHVRDDGAPLGAGENCRAEGTEVVCAPQSTFMTIIGVSVELDDGNDRLEIGDFGGTVTAGAGNDEIRSQGSMVVDGGTGADLIRVGEFSTVTYEGRTAGVRVSADDLPGDGEPGEGDDIDAGVAGIIGGDGDDELHLGNRGNRLVGNDGNDRLFGGERREDLFGGPGDDELHGGGENDQLDGGVGGDVLRGDGGVDGVAYRHAVGVAVTLDDAPGDGAAGEGDDVGSDVEEVRGTPGPDRLIGSDGPNVLAGMEGDDLLDGRGDDDILSGGGGRDRVLGGAGADRVSVYGPSRVETADGAIDAIGCDDGRVFVLADPFDRLESCAPDVIPPRTTRFRPRRDGTVLVPLRCSVGGGLPCRGKVMAFFAGGGSMVAGRARFELPRDGSRARVVLRLTRAARAELARTRRLRIAAIATTRRERPPSSRRSHISLTVLAPR